MLRWSYIHRMDVVAWRLACLFQDVARHLSEPCTSENVDNPSWRSFSCGTQLVPCVLALLQLPSGRLLMGVSVICQEQTVTYLETCKQKTSRQVMALDDVDAVDRATAYVIRLHLQGSWASLREVQTERERMDNRRLFAVTSASAKAGIHPLLWYVHLEHRILAVPRSATAQLSQINCRVSGTSKEDVLLRHIT